eukprot:sb/3468995/
MSDKSTQCNIPKSPRVEDKIYYRKEPVGIVHPYKDDIKMRPNSRILDKKLVTLDPRGGGAGPKKSLSLESLMDIIQTENKKRHMTKRGYSQQFESIQKFVTGLQKTTGSRSPPKTTPTVCTAQPAPQQPIAAPAPQTNLVRPVPHYPRTPLYAIPQQRKTSVPDDPSREKPWMAMGKPARYVSRSEDQLGRSQLPSQHLHAAPEQGGKFRRHSEVNRGGKWQPGKTHRWVLDNNTTMLESTL